MALHTRLRFSGAFLVDATSAAGGKAMRLCPAAARRVDEPKRVPDHR